MGKKTDSVISLKTKLQAVCCALLEIADDVIKDT